jgi:AcrR family transcriptional regulator
MVKTDRRVQRTREMLQKALIEILQERNYNTITIQEIVDRANVARTTFYVHFRDKDELFLSCHEAMVNEFRIGSLHPLSEEELLSSKAPAASASAYQHLDDARSLLYDMFQGQDSQLILRRIRESRAQEIESGLRAAFAESNSKIPLDMLANYLAGAQLALMQWWLEKRQPYSFEDITQIFHRLQRAAIREALGADDDN